MSLIERINDRVLDLADDFEWHTNIPLAVAISALAIIISVIAIIVSVSVLA